MFFLNSQKLVAMASGDFLVKRENKCIVSECIGDEASYTQDWVRPLASGVHEELSAQSRVPRFCLIFHFFETELHCRLALNSLCCCWWSWAGDLPTSTSDWGRDNSCAPAYYFVGYWSSTVGFLHARLALYQMLHPQPKLPYFKNI